MIIFLLHQITAEEACATLCECTEDTVDRSYSDVAYKTPGMFLISAQL